MCELRWLRRPSGITMGRAGTRPPLPELSETISRHLLAADCSGRFLPLLVASDTAIWTGRGVAQVAL
ncbi:hypothetical protein AMECASPLE_002747 [Ameca splendens]|uniref:Uncharacterized protein n=1 Tax=Ameca splendens TaxID=208324 RepID=A0ABV0XY78_9TELE